MLGCEALMRQFGGASLLLQTWGVVFLENTMLGWKTPFSGFILSMADE